MIASEHIDRIEGATAYDADGDKVGRVGELYLDDDTGRPSWVTVATGLFGTAETFVPLAGASFDGDDLRLGYSKDTIKDAPRFDTDEHLDAAAEDELHRHYGLGGAGTTPTTPTTPTDVDGDDRDDRFVEGEDLGDRGDAMTLSEERLDIGTRTQETRARLRRYVVTEEETITVPVRKEKLVVERIPAGDAAAEPITGPDQSEVVEEITLREERVVVGKETVAVEEVRVGKQEVTEEQEVTEPVHRERVDLDVDRDRPAR